MRSVKNGFFTATVIVSMMTGNVNAVEFGAFGNASYTDSDKKGANSSFVLGALDLYAAEDIDEKTDVFVEYVFENDGEGFVIDLERMWVKRRIDEAFQIAAGRFHAPLGYWNRTYHHGVLIQDTATRPQFLDFEDGEGAILPVHVVGLMATGSFDAGTSIFKYEVALANSSTFDSAASVNASVPGNGVEIGIANISDLSNDKSIYGRFTYNPKRLAIEFGAFAMSGTYLEAGGGDPQFGSLTAGKPLVDQTVLGGDFHFEKRGLRILAEYYRFDNQNKVSGNASFNAQAFYIQTSYQVTPLLRPVYRYESVSDITAGDVFFQILGAQNVDNHVIGLRLDLDDSNAVTFQVTNHQFDNPNNDFTDYIIDWSFMLF